jgi:GT2 family glycosyltransferase
MRLPGAELAIIIPVRNDASRLRTCLEAIGRNPLSARVSVIVADNGSTDESSAVAEAAGATVLPLPGHRVGELRNLAVGLTSAPLIAFVDADHIIDAGWIPAALDIFQDSSVVAAGAPYSAVSDANWMQRAYNRFRPAVQSAQPVEWLGSGNLIVRRDAFEQAGGFDARLESCEDVDLCNRLRRSGHRLVADPRLRSVHLGDPATARALFFGELWRGRDNIRVTLRGPMTLRALPSVLIPVINLACLIVLAGAAWIGRIPVATAALILLGLIGLRAARMSIGRGPLTAGDAAANVVVAAVYELGRALSLVARASHRTRRETAGERAVA